MVRYVSKDCYEDLAVLTNAARGIDPCDLVITNAQIIDVVNEDTGPGEIWVRNGVIVHVERDQKKFGSFVSRKIFNAKGAYVAPGFMDSHVHCESSCMAPGNFSRAIVVHGTTTIFTDCHEIYNVKGREGFKFMYEDALRNSVIRQFMLVPSCIPAAPGLETSGATLSDEDITFLADAYPDVVAGLAEVMDYINVIHGEKRMKEELNAARNRDLYLQSHFTGLYGNDLSAYLVTGLRGNHEIRDTQQMVEVLKAGGWVDMCGSSSISDRLDALLPALDAFPNPSLLNVTICTDDVHAKDLLDRSHGHINKVVARVIAHGIKPETAIAYATRNTAREYGIANLGAVAPGYLADLVIFDDFATIEPTAVFVEGCIVVEDSKIAGYPELCVYEMPSVEMTMRASFVTADQLIPVEPNGRSCPSETTVNTMSYKSGIYTELEPVAGVPLNQHGQIDIRDREDLCYVAVINRFGTGSIALGVMKDFGLSTGAVATTVSHDSHNLTLAYRDPELAAMLANDLIRSGGGFAAAYNDPVNGIPWYGICALPIAGLMSHLPAEKLAPEIQHVEDMLPHIFGGERVSILKSATLTLAVVPNIRVTDLGIVDTVKKEFVPLFPKT